MHEQRVVRTGGDDAHFQAVFFVPTGVAVQHVNVFRFIEVAHGQIAVGFVRGGGERDIDFGCGRGGGSYARPLLHQLHGMIEIGRASCRERV